MDNSKVYHILYISTSASPVKQKTIEDILYISTRNNKKNDITGILMYRLGYFLQCLEGDEAEVNALLKKISLDERHRDVKLVLEFKDEKRLFPQWNMGLISDDQDADALTKAVRNLKAGRLGFEGESSEQTIEILRLFSRKYLPSTFKVTGPKKIG